MLLSHGEILTSAALVDPNTGVAIANALTCEIGQSIGEAEGRLGDLDLPADLPATGEPATRTDRSGETVIDIREHDGTIRSLRIAADGSTVPISNTPRPEAIMTQENPTIGLTVARHSEHGLQPGRDHSTWMPLIGNTRTDRAQAARALQELADDVDRGLVDHLLALPKSS